MNNISIYIHWPFCLSLCPYCDFNSHIFSTVDNNKWINAYKSEIDYFAEKIRNREVRSIFFGGGTPSLMSSDIVDSIINKIASLGRVSQNTEITLEANPTSYETKKFKEFKSSGINRVSIGVQSFDSESLKLLGRKHSAKEAINAIESASKIFKNYSFDLIYAIPKQSLQEWQEELKFALSIAEYHISLYQLTIEKGTPFYKLFHNNELILPSDNIAAEMYDWTNNFLAKKQYDRYEISNYAKKGYECIHNLCYWNYDEYIGIGPGAHSRIHGKNSVKSLMMINKPEKWLKQVENQGNGIQNECDLTESEIIEEIIMMGTRLSTGAKEQKLKDVIGKNFDQILNKKSINHYSKEGLVNFQGDQIGFTDRGLIFHNYLVPRIIL